MSILLFKKKAHFLLSFLVLPPTGTCNSDQPKSGFRLSVVVPDSTPALNRAPRYLVPILHSLLDSNIPGGSSKVPQAETFLDHFCEILQINLSAG